MNQEIALPTVWNTVYAKKQGSSRCNLRRTRNTAMATCRTTGRNQSPRSTSSDMDTEPQQARYPLEWRPTSLYRRQKNPLVTCVPKWEFSEDHSPLRGTAEWGRRQPRHWLKRPAAAV